jgi:hypothetical protein
VICEDQEREPKCAILYRTGSCVEEGCGGDSRT